VVCIFLYQASDILMNVSNVVRSGELSEVESDGGWGEGSGWG